MNDELDRKTIHLYTNDSSGERRLWGSLCWEPEHQRADILYLDDDYCPQLHPLDIDSWPPTEADVKRAEITLLMLKNNMGRKGAP